MPNVVTVREAVKRAKQDGYPIAEHALRQLIKTGVFPVRKIGNKNLIFYPNLIRYLRCEDGGDNKPATVTPFSGIRRIDL